MTELTGLTWPRLGLCAQPLDPGGGERKVPVPLHAGVNEEDCRGIKGLLLSLPQFLGRALFCGVVAGFSQWLGIWVLLAPSLSLLFAYLVFVVRQGLAVR